MSPVPVNTAGSVRPPSGSAQQDTKSNLPMDGKLVGLEGVGDADVLDVVVAEEEVTVLVESVVDTVVLKEEVGGSVVEEEVEVGGVTLVVVLVGVPVGATLFRKITRLTGMNLSLIPKWQEMCQHINWEQPLGSGSVCFNGNSRGLFGGEYRNS